MGGRGGEGGYRSAFFGVLLSVAGKAGGGVIKYHSGLLFSLQFNWILIRDKFALWLRGGAGRLLGPVAPAPRRLAGGSGGLGGTIFVTFCLAVSVVSIGW